MMPFMCDSLLPIGERYASLKFRRLSRWFNPYRLDRSDLIELRAMLLTPGLLRAHVFALMHWHPNMARKLGVLAQLDAEAQPLVHANAMAVSPDDGRMMLHAILEWRADWSRPVPLWSTRYLQAQRRRGRGPGQLADEFGTTPGRISRWWKADLFDPLTGVARDHAAARWKGRVLGI